MNIHEFFQSSIKALERWLREHYSKTHWVADWRNNIENIQVYFDEVGGFFGNDYYRFDWKKAAYKRMGQLQTVMQCPNCLKATDSLECEDCHVRTQSMSEEAAATFFELMKYPLPDWALWDSCENEGWEAYCKDTHPKTDKVRDETLDCLKAIRDAQDVEERIDRLMWSLKIQHVNGNIAEDYMDDFWKLIDAVRSTGLEGAFSKQKVRDFMKLEKLEFEFDAELIEEVENAATQTTHND